MTNKEILDNIEADINTDSIIEYTEREVLIAMEHARYDEAINLLCMPKYKDEYSEVKVGDREMLLPKRLVGMLQMAAYDWPRVEIAKHYELSVRTVEAHFDSVRRSLGKKTFSAALVELYRKKIIK